MEIANDGRLKICWMRIVGFQQFQDVFLDFTHPETGEPLDKICLIGANGTGKTVVLEEIFGSISHMGVLRATKSRPSRGVNVIKLLFGKEVYYAIKDYRSFFVFDENQAFELGLETLEKDREREIATLLEKITIQSPTNQLLMIPRFSSTGDVIAGQPDSANLAIFRPCEGIQNSYATIDSVPDTTLNNALHHHHVSPSFEIVSPDNIISFWNNLISHSYQRLRKKMDVLGLPENKTKTIGEIDTVFDNENPEILVQLDSIWKRILQKAGLQLDLRNVKLPLALDDNLEAFITLKSTSQTIPYASLSSGIRNYIFSLGHIFSLYFNREIKRGFLLVDEPENGLFPDFLYDLVDVYRQVTTDKNGENNTQMFFATHEPIIAAQFEPYERIILEWNEDGTVSASRGVAPLEDDPNDLLRKDFGVGSLMGKAGNAAWKRFLSLRDQMGKEQDEQKREAIATEFLELGSKYGFSPR
jgi:predicted ATPase